MSKKQNVLSAVPRLQPEELRCGFARIGLCCNRCPEGPCRVDPFGHGPAFGVCGMGQKKFARKAILEKVVAGASAFIQEAEDFGLDLRENGGQNSIDELGNLSRLWNNSTVFPGDVRKELARAVDVIFNRYNMSGEEVELLAVRLALSTGYTAVAQLQKFKETYFEALRPGKRTYGPALLRKNKVNIVLDANYFALVPQLLKAAEEMTPSAKRVGAEGVQVLAAGREGDYLTGFFGLPLVGGKEVLSQAIAQGLVDLVLSKNLSEIALPFKIMNYRVKFIEQDEFPGNGDKQRKFVQDIISKALLIYQTREELLYEHEIGQEEIFLSGGGSGWITSIVKEAQKSNLAGIALLVNCNGEKGVSLAQEWLQQNFLVLVGGCGLDSFITSGLLRGEKLDTCCSKDLRKFMENIAQKLDLEILAPIFHIGGCHGILEGIQIASAVNMPLHLAWLDPKCNRAYLGMAFGLGHGVTLYLDDKEGEFISPNTTGLFASRYTKINWGEVASSCTM